MNEPVIAEPAANLERSAGLVAGQMLEGERHLRALFAGSPASWWRWARMRGSEDEAQLHRMVGVVDWRVVAAPTCLKRNV